MAALTRKSLAKPPLLGGRAPSSAAAVSKTLASAMSKAEPSSKPSTTARRLAPCRAITSTLRASALRSHTRSQSK